MKAEFRTAAPQVPVRSSTQQAVAPQGAGPAVRRRAERVSAESLPLRTRPQAPAAPHTPLRASPIAGLEVHEEPTAGRVDAARAEVAVSDQPVHEEMRATLAEGKRLQAELEADAREWLRELPELKDKPGYRVSLRREGGAQLAEAARLGKDGRVAEQVSLKIENGNISLREVVLHEGKWHLTERDRGTDEQGNATLHVQSSVFTHDVSPLEDRFLHRAKRLELAEVSFTMGADSVERFEKNTANVDGEGRRDRVDESKLSFKTYPAVNLKLDGQAEKAFRLDEPVIERHAHVTSKRKGDRTETTLLETAYSQGNVRAIETHDGGQPVLLVEKEVEPGARKESQLFRRGTQETVRTTTEVAGEEVRSRSVVWDSNGQPIGPESAKPVQLKTTDSVSRFGANGELLFQRETSNDLRTKESRVETFERTRDAERAIETVTLDETQGDETSRSTARRVNLVGKDGDVPLTVETSSDGHTVALTVTDEGLRYTTTLEDGTTREGLLVAGPGVGDLELRLNGKRVQIPSNAKEAARVLEKQFSDEELAGFDLALHEVSRKDIALRLWNRSVPGVQVRTAVASTMNFMSAHPVVQDTYGFALDEYGRLSSVMDALRNPIQREASFAREPIPGLFGQLTNAIGFLGVGVDALTLMDRVKTRQYFKAGTSALRTGERAVEYAGNAFGVLGAATPIGIGMRAGRSLVDVAEGGYNVFKGDTRFDRMRGAVSIASAGARVALALTIASGPAAPFLFAGLAATEALAFGLRVADNHYVAPMASDLKADPAPAPEVSDALRQQLAEDRKEIIDETQKKTVEEIAAAKLQPGDLTKKKGGTHLKFEVKDEDDKKYTFKPFEPGSVDFERDVMANALRSAGGEASAQPVAQTVTLPSGQTVEGYVKPKVKEEDDPKFGGDPTKWSKAEIREVLVDGPWAELLGNYDLKLDQYTAIDDSKPERVVDRDWDASLSDFKRNEPLERHKAFKAGFIAEKLGLAAPPAQALLYEAYVRGKMDVDFAPMFEAIERIQALTEDELREDMAPFLAKAFADGKTFEPFKTPEDVVAAVIDRKDHLGESFARLVQDLKDEREGLAHDRQRLIPSRREIHAWRKDLLMHLGEWFVESPLLKMVNRHMQKKEAKRLGITLT